MNFLIICSFYPPDSAISAVRPYMFAKYLHKAGHNVTVLRSGAFNSAPDSYFQPIDGVNVISFLGEKADTLRYEEGKYTHVVSSRRTDLALPKRYLARLKGVYHFITGPLYVYKRIKKAKKHYSLQKNVLQSIADLQFDIIFSTYGELENTFAGEYAAKLFHAKWIMDFRDPIIAQFSKKFLFWNLYTAHIQKHYIKQADFCTTVSECLTNKWRNDYPGSRIVTLYNGYDKSELQMEKNNFSDCIFRICYTGQIVNEYEAKALDLLVSCISTLIQGKSIEREKTRFVYAGYNSQSIINIFQKYGLNDILEDHGRVSRFDAQKIQYESDIFLVLSWNTKKSLGILTGKFYEGIRAHKPILSVIAGDTPHSELWLINQKYHYGYCHEMMTDDIKNLYYYINTKYDEKITKGTVDYTPSDELINTFRYEHITEKLISLSEKLLKESTD